MERISLTHRTQESRLVCPPVALSAYVASGKLWRLWKFSLFWTRLASKFLSTMCIVQINPGQVTFFSHLRGPTEIRRGVQFSRAGLLCAVSPAAQLHQPQACSCSTEWNLLYPSFCPLFLALAVSNGWVLLCFDLEAGLRYVRLGLWLGHAQALWICFWEQQLCAHQSVSTQSLLVNI